MKDLSNVTGTYTNCLVEKKDELSALCENLQNYTITVPEFKSKITDFVSTAKDTPAKQNFIKNIIRKNDRMDLVFYVYNSMMAGMNIPVI